MKTFLAICNNCGRTFDYTPSPQFREEFHYCSKDDSKTVTAERHAKDPASDWNRRFAESEAINPWGKNSYGKVGYFEVPE